MPVTGNELASLDFANLIGGPLNAVVEAQAKSAITTANFIREVGFDEDGVVRSVDFKYTRLDDATGQDAEFTLSLPFITMVPIPYVVVESATIEFNAKITSVQEKKVSDELSTEVNLSTSAKAWFVSAQVQSKTSYQKKSATTDREERTFDMHVSVVAKSGDMPSGTERLMTLLENVITERKGGGGTRVTKTVATAATSGDDTVTVSPDAAGVQANATFSHGGTNYTIASISGNTLTLTGDLAADIPQGTTLNITNPPGTRSSSAAGGTKVVAAGSSPSAPGLPNPTTAATTVVTEMVIDGDISKFTAGARLSIGGVNYTIAGLDPTNNKLLLSRT